MKRHYVCLLCAASLFFCGCGNLQGLVRQDGKLGESALSPVVQSSAHSQDRVWDDEHDLEEQSASQGTQTQQQPDSEQRTETKTVFGYKVRYTLPAAWVDACTVEAGEESILFFHTASRDSGGLLMIIYFNDIGAYDPAFVPLGQIDGYEYGYVTPMDVQFSPETQAQYEQLFAQVETVANSFGIVEETGDADNANEQTCTLNGRLVTFSLPQQWQDVTCEVGETSIAFYHEPSRQMGGLLMIFAVNPVGASSPAFEVLGQIDALEYGYALPVDVQFPPEQQAAYEALLAQVPQVASSFYVR